MLKQVAVLTTFTSHDDAYSLCNVTLDQLKMLVGNGYKVKVFVQESGWWKNPDNLKNLAYKDVELIFLPGVACHNEVKIDPTFKEDVDKLYKVMKDVCKDIDVILTHDIIYQPAALKHNVAARKVASDYPNIKWLHWIHSATSPFTLTTQLNIFKDAYIENIRDKFPNSKYVFFNHYSIPRIAKNFNINENDVAVVHHPTDVYQLYRFSQDAKDFSEKFHLLEADYIGIYPCRLDRGKNVQMVIKTMAALKKLRNNVRCIIADFHSTGGDKLSYRDELKAIGKNEGLTEEELIWTSEFKPEWRGEISRDTLSMLYTLINVFIMPSMSESYSLVTQESMLFGATTVINDDFPPFRDIFGVDTIYRKFSSNIDKMNGMDGSTDTKYDNEAMYHMETALAIVAQAESSKSFKQKNRVRKERNLNYVFHHELEPLINA